MDTDLKLTVIGDIIDDFRSSMQPENLTERLRDPETANRIFLAVTTQPEGILWQGIRDRLRGMNAMCSRLGHRHIAYIDDAELIEESLEKCVLPFCSEPRSVVRDRFRWGQSFLKGHDRDITTVWSNREPDEAFESLRIACTDTDAAHYLTLQVFERHASKDYNDYVKRTAVRLGLVCFADSIDESRLEHSFREMLDEADEPDLMPALSFAARTTCKDDPNCSACRAWNGCWYLSRGFA